MQLSAVTENKDVDCSFVNSVDALVYELHKQELKPSQLTRVEQRIPAINMLSWLQSNAGVHKNYWANRDKTFILSGIGSALTVRAMAPSQIPAIFHDIKQIVKNQAARFIGGVGFNSVSQQGEWNEYPFAEFILPQIEILFRNNQYWLAVNIFAENLSKLTIQCQKTIQLLQSIQWCDGSLDQSGDDSVDDCLSHIRIIQKSSIPTRVQWSEIVQRALLKIKAAEFDKVVLSREVVLTLSEPVSALQLLGQWEQKNRNCFSFCLQSPSGAFLGCSPEQLFSRAHRYLNTEAIAGTVLRGSDNELDLQLEHQLKNDPKLLREHQMVVDFLFEQLADLSDTRLEKEPLTVLKLAKVQHLQMPMKARLKPNIDDADIMLKLHPTPAVCGSPREHSMYFINQQEAASRGWYAGAVGTIGYDETEFSVAIRSLLVNDEVIHCYSGVGLVEGSEEQMEWQELNAKIETLMSLFDS